MLVGDGAIDATMSVVQPRPMNTKWFRGQLRDKDLSQRGLAKLLGIDPAAVSLMLRGQRRMTLQEAHRISEVLGVATAEVLREAGIPTDDGIKRVPISGICGSEGIVQLLAARTHEKVIAPADVPRTRTPSNAASQGTAKTAGCCLSPLPSKTQKNAWKR